MTERTMSVCVSEEFLSFLEREAASWGYEDAQAHLQGLVDWAISHTMLIHNEMMMDASEEAAHGEVDFDTDFDDGIPF